MAPFMRKRDKKKEKAKAEAAAKKKKELYVDVTLGSAGKRGKGRRQRVSKALRRRYGAASLRRYFDAVRVLRADGLSNERSLRRRRRKPRGRRWRVDLLQLQRRPGRPKRRNIMHQ
jgi:hypothetical protein